VNRRTIRGVCFSLTWAALLPVGLGPGPAAGAIAAAAPARTGSTNAPGRAPAPAAPAASAEERLAEARADLAAAAALDDAHLTNAPPGISTQENSLRRALLQRLVRLYEQQLSTTAELEAAKRRRIDLTRDAQAWSGFTEPRPYSVLLTDNLRERIQAERLALKNAGTALTLLDEISEENRRALAVAEEHLRQVNEQLEGTKDPATAAGLSRRRELERLRSQVAAATLAALGLERQIRQERLVESRTRLDLLQRQLPIAEAGARFTQADLDLVTARLETERRQLEAELGEAQARQRAATQALATAREELRQAQAQSDTAPSVVARLAEVAELRRTQLETADSGVNSLRAMLEAGNAERTMWEQRFAAYESRSAEVLRQSQRGLENLARRVALWKDYYRQQLEVSASQIALLEARVQGLDPASGLAPLVRDRLTALRDRDQMLARVFRMIERVERLAERWDEGLRDAADRLPFVGRVRHVFSDTGSLLERLWTFELFTAEDTITVDGQPITGKRSVTVGKVVTALLILLIGYWITGVITRVLEPIIVKRLKIERNQAILIRRWLRVVLVVSLVLFSLVSVKIPLTIFAFAGGALAIGLGFGMQTVLKNFVSGIILLFERPFRVGDVLDVAGHRGMVTSIGLRASVLQLWDGTETLIPNSSLLENNVTNWTYSNHMVRFTVAVGVAYGSDPRRVVQLLTELSARHGLVEKSPAPQVLFTDFGESALMFELRFWVNVLRHNAAQVASDLRQMIAGVLAENGLTIAFPQRDLHLDTSRPLQVQMVPPSSAGQPTSDRARPS
jgi:small-conductance mechanosensitive channel